VQIKSLLILLVTPLGAAASAAHGEDSAGIGVHQLSPTSFELTISVVGEPALVDAQRSLLPTAQSICRPLAVSFGHYAFESKEPASAGPLRPTGLLLKQEISCGVDNTAAQPTHHSYDWSPSVMDNANIERMTYDYLAEKDANRFKDAYDRFSESMKAAARFESWSKQMEAFNSQAGAAQSTKVQKISWSKDPPGVDPGFYAAVDYSRQFKNVPVQCGYVAWYRDADGRFSIVREEQNSIDQASKARMTSKEIAATLAKFGCGPEP
jgi:hypothetical protein